MTSWWGRVSSAATSCFSGVRRSCRRWPVGVATVLRAFDEEHRDREVGAQRGQVHVRRHAVALQPDKIDERVIFAGLVIGLRLGGPVFGGGRPPGLGRRRGDLGLVLADHPAHLAEAARIAPRRADAFHHRERCRVVAGANHREQLGVAILWFSRKLTSCDVPSSMEHVGSALAMCTPKIEPHELPHRMTFRLPKRCARYSAISTPSSRICWMVSTEFSAGVATIGHARAALVPLHQGEVMAHAPNTASDTDSSDCRPAADEQDDRFAQRSPLT